jgi:glycosyltransferase family 2
MNNIPLISIITVSYNAVKTIEETILSVLNQTYHNIEYIIIDGGSTDGTIDIIKKYQDRISYWVSEPDKGIYDAMNKGTLKASGEWLNFMNAGDTFYDEQVLEKVFKDKDWSNTDVIYGDVIIKYSKKEELKKVWPLTQLEKGMPFCHQSSFIKTTLQKQYSFNTNYKICSDYEFFYTLYKKGYRFKYTDIIIAKFLYGGLSSDAIFNLLVENWIIGKKNYKLYFIYLLIKVYLIGIIKKIINNVLSN